jgi:predicted amidohydrolase YtcJ
MSKPAISAAFAAALYLGTSASAVAANQADADTILTNARVYTVEDKQPWAEAVAIKDGKIVAVGSAATVAKRRGASTQVVDMGGRLILPAFGDAHVHPLFGALSRSRCPLQDGKTIADYQSLIAKCVAAVPGDGAVYGIGWSDALFPPNGIPRKELLDAVSTTRPLIFESAGGHTYWLNSKALEVAKITRDTKDPVNGTIDRDPATRRARRQPAGSRDGPRQIDDSTAVGCRNSELDPLCGGPFQQPRDRQLERRGRRI